MLEYSQAMLKTAVRAALEYFETVFWEPVIQAQHKTTLDRGVFGPRWVSKFEFSAPPEDGARQVLLDAIKALGNDSERYDIPSLEAVPAQWVSYRHGIGSDEPEPVMTEKEKYTALVGATNKDLTIMYMYGGAHYIFGPATRRGVATTLSRKTKARCVIIQHRLAPQNPFPCAPLDILHAYLSLLYPPPNSFHEPVSPENLILAGDSSGGQLAFSLVQTILAAHRRSTPHPPTLRFHNQTVTLPLPAGIATQSPGFDHLGGCLPSWTANKASDIFPDATPSISEDFSQDAAWPTDPPRGNLYSELPTMAHPLVSPITASGWTGAPPIYIAVGGGERCLDGAKVVGQRAGRQGVPVIWEEYEMMPHNWPMILKGWPQSERCMDSWAAACLEFWHRSGKIATRGRFFPFEADGDGKRELRGVDVLSLTELDERAVRRFVERKIAQVDSLWKKNMEKARSRL